MLREYSQIGEQINSLDFVVMFMPIEAAYLLAIQDKETFEESAKSKVVLAGLSNILVIATTIAVLWARESQKKNVSEIAKEGGLLHDKFVDFTKDLDQIGNCINKLHDTYHSAINNLKDGRNSIVKRCLKLKELGASTQKATSSAWAD